MFDVFHEELARARSEEPAFVVATVVAVRGSSSAKPGAKAIINGQGRNRWGWVGGGCAESFLIEQSLEAMAAKRPRVVEVDLDDELLGVGMPCGGYMDVYLEPIFPPKELHLCGSDPAFAPLAVLAHGESWNVIVNNPEARADDFPFATRIDERTADSIAPTPGARWLVSGTLDVATANTALDAGVAGIAAERFSEPLERDGLREGLGLPSPATKPNVRAAMMMAALIAADNGGTGESLSINPRPAPGFTGDGVELLIVGHSRIAEELARLGVLLGWSVTVNSPEIDADNFPTEATLITDDMDMLMEGMNPNTHLVIASQHKGDHGAARNALRNGVQWIGLVASKKRSGLVFEFLAKQEGISEDMLGAVQGPAGLDICAVTPFDIALSSIVQIIQRVGNKA